MTFPVDEIREELVDAVKSGQQVLLRAPTGSGKSTRVPGVLADMEGLEGLIIVVQPRRMAARLLAGFVAKERGSRLGEEVGYAVRFDSKWGKKTRILYVTDGLLQRWLTDKPDLLGVSAVIFDEFHERRLASDVALGRCLSLVRGSRPDLRLLVMSATIQSERLTEYLSPCSVVEASGRTFPVEIEYRAANAVVTQRSGPSRQEMLWDRVAKAVKTELQRGEKGHILVFLPGIHEIRKSCELISQSSWSSACDVMPLYSTLPPAQQDAAVKSGGKQRIIISTNVAETSLTIDGVTVVIDSGLARQAAFDVRRGFDSLTIGEISQASADQRAGRAGRTRPGRCVRLWSEANQRRRQPYERPEIYRVDLAECVLQLANSGWGDVADFPWLDAPDSAALDRAIDLLHLLGALDENGRLSEEGEQMVSLPLHPRLGRLILTGAALGCPAEACFAAAILQGEGVFVKSKGATGRRDFQSETDRDDFTAEYLAYETALRSRFDVQLCRRAGILARGARETQRGFQQIAQICERLGIVVGDVQFHRRPDEFGRAMLAAYADRVAVRLSPTTLACRVSGQRRGRLDEASVVRDDSIFIATEMTEVEGKDLVVYLNRCVALEESWLDDMFPGDLQERQSATYDESRRRVVAARECYFHDLVLRREEKGEVDLGAAAEILAARVLSRELVLKQWGDSVEQWIARLTNLCEWMPELELPSFSEEDRQAAIEQVCFGAVSYKEIKDRDPWAVLREWLSAPQRAALDSFAPERITLANGQKPKLRYELGKPPVIALKVQQLYGVEETPCIANGKVPVMVHICAPNQRPWQMTTDLKSFWENGFAQMKKDLAGRYPKHDWR